MQETFRLRKHVRLLGIVFVAFFLPACVAYGSLFFIDEPFGNGRSGFPMGVMGLSVFGPMLVMSCFYLWSYYAEQFSIDGGKLTVRSILQNRQFDISDIALLRWTIHPAGGGIRFGIGDRNVRLDLYGYSNPDRLRIIRMVRELVPAEVQDGWAMFCHKIALPLRDGKPSLVRVKPPPSSFRLTRRRYNRALFVSMPLSVIAAVSLANRFQMKEFLALPGIVAAAVLFLRSAIPKNGRTEFTFHSRWRDRAAILAVIGVLCSIAAMFGLKLFEFESTGWSYLPIGFALASFPPMFFCLNKADRERLTADEAAAEGAAEEWREGETIESIDAD